MDASWALKAREESELSPEDCASAIGCSRNTYLNREKNPGDLTLNEIGALQRRYTSKAKIILRNALDQIVQQ